MAGGAPTHPKPSQGLKHKKPMPGFRHQIRSNPPQTLSGIETDIWMPRMPLRPGRSNPPQTLSGIETSATDSRTLASTAPTHPKPSQGLKRTPALPGCSNSPGSNPPQTLSGIETMNRAGVRPSSIGSNPPQTLSGIETERAGHTVIPWEAPTHPKPSQGLKHQGHQLY